MTTVQTTPLVLRMNADGEGIPLPLGLAGYAKSIEGMPVHYRRAKIARVGKWTHRGTGEQFEISAARADEWVKNTAALAAAGVTPFLPDTHVTDKSGAANHGYVINVERDGDDVYAVLQLIGDKALEAAATRGRSVYVVNDARDAHGRVYPGESLAHVALVPNPALPDLGPTVRIAASATATAVEVPVLELNCGTGAGGFQQGNTCAAGDEGKSAKSPHEMSYEEAKHEQERLEQKLRAATQALNEIKGAGSAEKVAGISVMNLTPDSVKATPEYKAAKAAVDKAFAELRNFNELFTKKFKNEIKEDRRTRGYARSPAAKLSLSGAPMTEQQLDTIGEIIGADDVTDETAIDRLLAWSKQAKEKPAAAEAKVTALSADVKRLEKERDDAAAKVLSLSASAPKSPDAVTLAMYQDNIAAKRESAVKSGAISEAEAKEFDKLIADAQGQPTPLALSASTGGRPLAFALWDTIGKLGTNGIRVGNAVSRGNNGGGLALSGESGTPTAEEVMRKTIEETQAWQKSQLQTRGLQTA